MKIGYIVRSKIRERLKGEAFDGAGNALAGWNEVIERLAPTYGIDIFSNDFESGSVDYVEANISLDELMGVGLYRPRPALIQLYTTQTQAGKDPPVIRFSGIVTACLDVTVVWEQGSVPRNSEDYADLVEEALVDIINSTGNTWWGDGIGYNGEIGISKGPLETGGTNWQKIVACRATFIADPL